MIFSTLNEIGTSRSLVDVFGGYNHNIRITDGEFYDMKNMTSSHYPVLSPRGKRGVFEFPDPDEKHDPYGMISKDSLCYVDGHSLYINNEKVEGLVLEKSKKQLVSMGAYIIIMPDKKYINTKDLTEFGDIEASFATSSRVEYQMCRIDGTKYDVKTIGSTAPSDPANMDYWIDTSTTPHTLKQYSESSSMWVQIATTYVKISSPGIASLFEQYDAVTISGISSSISQLVDILEGKTSIIWDIHKDEDGNGAGDYIVMVGFLDEVSYQDEKLTLERKIPIMDFVIESNNRLWGCRYGTDLNGNVVNEIYASKLGDFKNWNFFAGTASDSYAVSCGTDGEWTGAITHLGYPLFFKENYIHKIYGNYPSNYQVQTTACRGIMRGAGDSLAVVNEALMYKSRNGVCWYDGSLPTEISSAFGNVRYSGVDDSEGCDPLRNGAVAGFHQNKYYISMKSEDDGKWNLFVYDVKAGMWHREDETRVDAFCSCGGEMYYIDHYEKKIKTILGSGTLEGGDVDWMVESGVLGTDMPDRKYISRIMFRLSLTVGASVMIYIQYDSCGDWEHLATMKGTSMKSVSLPVRPKRCDHFRLRIIGKGDAKVYSITKNIEQGSDI